MIDWVSIVRHSGRRFSNYVYAVPSKVRRKQRLELLKHSAGLDAAQFTALNIDEECEDEKLREEIENGPSEHFSQFSTKEHDDTQKFDAVSKIRQTEITEIYVSKQK